MLGAPAPRVIVDGMTDGVVPVRIVEWNVSMALHKKAHLLAGLAPSIAILPESTHPDKARPALEAIGATRSPTSIQWAGANRNKGLSVVAFDGWDLRLDDSYDEGYQWVLPVHAIGPRKIRLLAVWDMGNRGKGYESARQWGSCRASLTHYADFLAGDADAVVISGDFNKSVYWDTPQKKVKFGDFVGDLESRGFTSAYHRARKCEQGAEPDPTLWWMRDVNKPYHIDYTFVRPVDALLDVAVGSPEDWITYSDHPPMTVDLRL